MLGEKTEQVGALQQVAVFGTTTKGQLQHRLDCSHLDRGAIGQGTVMVHDDKQAAAATSITRHTLYFARDFIEQPSPGAIKQGAPARAALFQADTNWMQQAGLPQISKYMVGALETSSDIKPMMPCGTPKELGGMDLGARAQAVKRIEIRAHRIETEAGLEPTLVRHEHGAEDKQTRGGADHPKVSALIEIDDVHGMTVGGTGGQDDAPFSSRVIPQHCVLALPE